MFQRKLPNGQVVNRDWMIYSENSGRVFCGPCLLLNNKQSTFGTKEGFSDWRNATKRIKGHEGSSEHKQCLLDFMCRGKELGKIDHDLASEVNAEISYWRNVLKHVVAIVFKLTSRGLALQGSNEKLKDPHNGNFLMCVELLLEFDPFMADHVARFAEKGTGNVNYLSSNIYEEFIQLMADLVVKYIINQVERAKYFSIIVDSTPNVSHCDQLSVIVHYVREDGTPVERFLTFMKNVGHKASDMYKAIEKLADEFG